MGGARPAFLNATRVNVQGVSHEFHFSLTHPGEEFVAPTEAVLPVRVKGATLATLCDMVSQAIMSANAGADEAAHAVRRLAAAGSGLCNELFPEISDPRVRELRRRLLDTNGPLLVSTDDPTIFWELLHDGRDEDGFLALKCDVGRRLKTRGVPSGVPRKNPQLRALIVSDPNEGDFLDALPSSKDEARRLRDWLIDRGVDCRDYLEGEAATLEAVLERFLSTHYDLIHFAGHIVRDERAEEYALSLSGGKLLHASTIRNQVKGAPLVFLNACWSGTALGIASTAGRVAGMTDAFLEAGAQVVIGALVEVPDFGARLFAEKFYELVLEGRPVGEAIRKTRIHLKSTPRSGATWASFVMYGDPCLTIEIRRDELQDLLAVVNLTREHFDVSCLRVIEQAFTMSRPSAHVSSMELFAALLGSEEGKLRERLRNQGCSPERMSRMFGEVVREVNSKLEPSGELKFSQSVRRTLKSAAEAVGMAGVARIREEDVISAFVAHGRESVVADILRRLEVDIDALRSDCAQTEGPTAKDAPEMPESASTFLRPEDFEPIAWRILETAQGLAGLAQDGIFGERHLLAGMLLVEGSELRKALDRLGADAAAISRLLRVDPSWTPAPSAVERGRLCRHSAGVAALLSEAAVNAVGSRKEATRDLDLLHALAGPAGRTVSVVLERVGFPPRALVSRVFGSDGRLVLDAFEARAAGLMQAALRFACEKGHGALARRHLAYALLADRGGLFARHLHHQGMDVEVLADMVDASMSAASEPRDVQDLMQYRRIAPTLVRLLCATEDRTPFATSPVIEERRLVLAALNDGLGEYGQFMIARGVRWARLRASINDEAAPAMH